MDNSKPSVSLDQALRAQRALREAAGLPPEVFPMEAFVGMISDEIDELRKIGKNDGEIARLITSTSSIEITASQIADNYAPPELRHGPQAG